MKIKIAYYNDGRPEVTCQKYKINKQYYYNNLLHHYIAYKQNTTRDVKSWYAMNKRE